MKAKGSLKLSFGWARPVIVTVLCVVIFVGYFCGRFIFSTSPSATDLAFDDRGNAYITDSDRVQVQKFNTKGDQIGTIGSRGRADGQFQYIYGPSMITVDHEGTVYVANSSQTYIQKFDSRGNFLAKLRLGRSPRQLLTDSRNQLIVLFEDKPFIGWYSNTGQRLTGWSWLDATIPAFDAYSRLAIDNRDNLYTMASGFIYKYDAQGRLQSQWPLKGGRYTCMTVDNQGQVYASDNITIQKYDPQGQLLTSWSEPQNPYRYIWGLKVNPSDRLYVLGRTQGQTFVQGFDDNLGVKVAWTSGLPYWFSTLWDSSMYMVALGLGYVIRRAWRNRLRVNPTETEPLPAWVEEGKVNPQLLQDHLDLARMPKTNQALRRNARDSGLIAASGLAFILGMIILFVEDFSFRFDDKLTFDLPVLILLGFLVLSIATVWQRARALIKKEEDKTSRQQALIRQVQGTFPSGSGSVFVTRGFVLWKRLDWSILWAYLVFYLVPIVITCYSYNGDPERDWFSGWPGWVIEITLVVSLVGSGLAGVWLLNRLQTERPGKIRLNRAEMGSLQVRAWLWLLGFAGLTIVLGSLDTWLLHPENAFDSGNYLLKTIVVFVRYGFLAFGFFYVPKHWLNAPYKAGNYEAARRRVVYWRRWSKTLNTRLYHAEILRVAGRFQEAEYILQESLAKPKYQTQEDLAKILAALGLVRLDQERYAEAMFLLENSLLLSPVNRIYLNNLAEVYLRLNQWPNRVLMLNNQIVPATNITLKSTVVADRLVNLAWAQAQLGRWPEAERNLAEAFKKVPPRDKPFRASLLLRAGLVMQLKGDYRAAMENYQQATILDPAGSNGQKAAEYLAYNQAALPTSAPPG